MQSLPKPPITLLAPAAALIVSLPPLPNRRSAPLPARIVSAASEESLPPTTVCPALDAPVSTVSAPASPNSTIDPMLPPATMQSFSVPPETVPVLPACSTTVSLPESPNTWALPAPVRMQSSPARPAIVPGPGSAVWLSVSLALVPVTL